MQSNYYMKKLYQDMQLRGYTEHTQEVYGRVVGKFLNFSGKSIEALDEHDVRNYVLHLMSSDLSKSSINTYQAALRFFFIYDSKGNKDRYTILSRQCLEFYGITGVTSGPTIPMACCSRYL